MISLLSLVFSFFGCSIGIHWSVGTLVQGITAWEHHSGTPPEWVKGCSGHVSTAVRQWKY
ncbi:hypothetical protein KVT40_000454 [Elsinoe batatas]|uniref:Uncharacterized protein n=1 Tax=Elsinoe batatas TaxID=2601811 RepID=A0A8K0LA49_9PEZI|nr:hypothetical protein KVT40_000454 [Elsinoe batatas]